MKTTEEKITPLNAFIKVKPLIQVREAMIALPEVRQQRSFVLKVLQTGPDVKSKIVIPNRIILANKEPFKINGQFFIRESDIVLVKADIWRPFGKRLMVERLNSEFSINGIIIPDCYQNTDQSLHCVFFNHGIQDDEQIFEYPLVAGDIIRLEKWDKEIREVDIDGRFFLIVKPSHILYKSDDDDSSNRIIK